MKNAMVEKARAKGLEGSQLAALSPDLKFIPLGKLARHRSEWGARRSEHHV
jgi:hypothetical protein